MSSATRLMPGLIFITVPTIQSKTLLVGPPLLSDLKVRPPDLHRCGWFCQRISDSGHYGALSSALPPRRNNPARAPTPSGTRIQPISRWPVGYAVKET